MNWWTKIKNFFKWKSNDKIDDFLRDDYFIENNEREHQKPIKNNSERLENFSRNNETKYQKEIKQHFNWENLKEIDIDEFLKFRSRNYSKTNDYIYSRGNDFGGVYILFNKTIKMYYIGQSKEVYKRVWTHFTGGDWSQSRVYTDYTHNHAFTVKFIAFDKYAKQFSSLINLERKIISECSKNHHLYNQDGNLNYKEDLKYWKQNTRYNQIEQGDFLINCPRCKNDYAMRDGPFGLFASCKNHHCNYTFSIKHNQKIENLCEKCENNLVIKMRKGNKGFFIGCSNYPYCEQAENIPYFKNNVQQINAYE